MRHPAVSLLVLCVLGSAGFATRWERLGPVGGSVPALAAAPSNPAVVYAANSAVFRSTDGGRHWVRTADVFTSFGPEAATPAVRALGVSGSDPNRVLAATPQGLFITTNGGASWKRAGSISADVIAVAWSLDGKRAYASSQNALHRSADSGATWETIAAPTLVALAVDPASAGTVFAARQSADPYGLYLSVSTTSGSAWTPFSTVDRPVGSLRFNAAGDTLYASAPMAGGGLYRISKTGATALAHPSPSVAIAAPYTGAPWVLSAVNPATDTVPAYRVWDAGTADKLRTGFSARGPLSVAFGSDLMPLCGTVRGGVMALDGADVWHASNPGLDLAEVSAVWENTAPARVMVAALGDGLYRSISNGDAWTLCHLSTNRSVFGASRAKPGRVYHTGANGIEVSEDSGATWRNITNGLPTGADIVQIVPSPSEPDIVLAVTSDYAVYRKTTTNGNWTRTLAPLASPPAATPCLASSPGDAGRWYLVRPEGLLISSDGGATWTLRNAAVNLPGTLLAVDPRNADTLYRAQTAGTTVSVWKSTDGGLVWGQQHAETGASGSGFAVTFLAVDPRSPDRVLLGTNRGLRIRSTAGGAFSPQPVGPRGVFCASWAPTGSAGDLLGTAGSGILRGRPDTQGAPPAQPVTALSVLPALNLIASGGDPTPEQLATMDMNDDTAVTMADADLILRAAVGP
jgi:photosystem II stability/assembly factor-like uncharacterized protein